jgi:hypothetical protein
MGRATPQTHAKRLREQAKQAKKREKSEKKAARKLEKESGVSLDSDLASEAPAQTETVTPVE